MSGWFVIAHPEGPKPNVDLCESLTDSLARRAPGERRTAHFASASIGMALLGDSRFPDESTAFDGRFNERGSLCKQLGVSPTTTDAALARLAYKEWQEDCLKYLTGDFCFAIWDQSANKLFAARDQLGFKPIFRSRLPHGWLISNSLGLMLRHPDVSDELDRNSVADFLLHNMVVRADSESTPFSSVKSLPRASILEIDGSGVRIRTYWSVPEFVTPLSSKSDLERAEVFKCVLDACVRDRIASDRMSISLSGGTDSGSVAALAAQAGARATAFTMSFKGVHDDDEWRYAAAMASHCGWKHERVPGESLRLYEPSTWDLNLQRGAVVSPAAVMARKMAAVGPVSLNGLSGDNILGVEPPSWNGGPVKWVRNSCDWFQARKFMVRRPPLGLRHKQMAIRPFDPPPYINPDFSESYCESRWKLYEDTRLRYFHGTHPSIVRSLDTLDWTERFADDLPYEARDPFFDIRMLNLAMSLDPFHDFAGKLILRRAMQHAVPDPILNRRKRMFGDLYTSYLRVADPSTIDGWTPHPELGEFVDRTRVLPIAGAPMLPELLFMYSKAYFLNEWLLGLDRARAAGYRQV